MFLPKYAFSYSLLYDQRQVLGLHFASFQHFSGCFSFITGKSQMGVGLGLGVGFGLGVGLGLGVGFGLGFGVCFLGERFIRLFSSFFRICLSMLKSLASSMISFEISSFFEMSYISFNVYKNLSLI